MTSSFAILGEQGKLSHALEGFKVREAQLEMAFAIERAISLKNTLIVEAGTGTGKTFAYLVPVFLSDEKTILSTGTKNLQDQLFYKDIPLIKKLLSSTKKVVLLKGRGNYVCLYRLKQNMLEGRFASHKEIAEINIINEWSLKTKRGDINEISEVPEDSPVWFTVTSNADNCLGKECAFYDSCFVVKARKEAFLADILIVNHHLFFSDLALQEDGFGELLPGANITIFDEAHHLPELASQFFSTKLSSKQLLELAQDTHKECEQDAKDMQIIFDAVLELQKSISEMRLALGKELRRAVWPEMVTGKTKISIENMKSALQKLEAALKEIAVRSPGLENCWKRSLKLMELFNQHTQIHTEDFIHWYETYTQSFSIHLTPLKVAEDFKQFLKENKRTWIFTSATLTVKNSFQLFVNSLGLDNALSEQFESPFHYAKQAILYVPRGLPDPRDANYHALLVEAILPVLEITQGKAFILFTSYKALAEVEHALSAKVNFPLLVQGSKPKQQLIEDFKQTANGILLGTNSFWYGVDVRGPALSCVIIDKLPFAAPDDPILQSRIKMLRRQGLDPFQEYQLPHAVLNLKQGVGRLIRGSEDRGILMICDPRLCGSRYGEIFLNSLPNMGRTRELTKVVEFFKHENISH